MRRNDLSFSFLFLFFCVFFYYYLKNVSLVFFRIERVCGVVVLKSRTDCKDDKIGSAVLAPEKWNLKLNEPKTHVIKLDDGEIEFTLKRVPRGSI